MTDELNEDITLLWDWRINKGMQFLASESDVLVLRQLLDGKRLKDVRGFEWLRAND